MYMNLQLELDNVTGVCIHVAQLVRALQWNHKAAGSISARGTDNSYI